MDLDILDLLAQVDDERRDRLSCGRDVEEADEMQERACIDEYSPGRSFCKIYQINERMKKVLITHKPQASSPSWPFASQPHMGIDIVLDSVFRGLRRSKSGSASSFTCFFVAPRLSSNDSCERTGTTSSPGTSDQSSQIAFSAGHSYDKADIETVMGCSGTFVSSKSFHGAGFKCSTHPFVAINAINEDLACFQAVDTGTGGLCFLPCSPEEVPTSEPFVATFSYPAVDTFLINAYEELVSGVADHGVWAMYANEGWQQKQELYKLLKETFVEFKTGELLCSTGYLKSWAGPRLAVKTSTLSGSSGGPVVPAILPGYFVAIHDGGNRNGDVNYATSTDAPSFVEAYSKFVLPHLPPQDSILWKARDTSAFERWLAKHNLNWKKGQKRKAQAEADPYLTPATTKSISVSLDSNSPCSPTSS